MTTPTNPTYGMFTPEGNYMIARIVDAAKKLVAEDGDQLTAWAFAYRELRKLGYSDAFGEATDTDVREQVYVTGPQMGVTWAM